MSRLLWLPRRAAVFRRRASRRCFLDLANEVVLLLHQIHLDSDQGFRVLDLIVAFETNGVVLFAAALARRRVQRVLDAGRTHRGGGRHLLSSSPGLARGGLRELAAEEPARQNERQEATCGGLAGVGWFHRGEVEVYRSCRGLVRFVGVLAMGKCGFGVEELSFNAHVHLDSIKLDLHLISNVTFRRTFMLRSAWQTNCAIVSKVEVIMMAAVSRSGARRHNGYCDRSGTK